MLNERIISSKMDSDIDFWHGVCGKRHTAKAYGTLDMNLELGMLFSHRSSHLFIIPIMASQVPNIEGFASLGPSRAIRC